MSEKAKRTETKKEDLTELQRLAKKAMAAQKVVREFEEEHEKILATYKHLQETVVGVNEQIKVEARKFSRQGVNRTLVDLPNVIVVVQGKEQRQFDVKAVKRRWSEKILASVLFEEVDGKLVDKLVENGELSEGEVSQVVKFIPMTPAVSIRYP